MGSASTLFLASSAIAAVGTVSSIRAKKEALARENVRIETERQMADLKAIEESNDRRDMALKELANNVAFQSTTGYFDDSQSYTNINKQVFATMDKDLANIRLMGKSVDVKYRQDMFENNYGSKQLTFGGYTSVLAGLTNGYAKYKYYKT
tara:strand:+ start:55 stop:504 length:450 start_codon:yes stop_codon:yes gene_type:complete